MGPREPNQLRVILPLPHKDLSANTNKGWRRIASLKKDYRLLAMVLGKNAIQEQKWHSPERVSMSVEFAIKGSRGVGYAPRDEANALTSVKAGIDGLIDAGVVVDDDRRHLTVAGISIRNDDGPWVLITFKGE